MNLEIKQLMAQPAITYDLAWLKKALQSAIALELSTLPPYLCGLWCLKDQGSDPASWVSQITFDEMAHLGLVCNMLAATGVRPDILGAYAIVVYPGPLPGGVRPKCDKKFFPCDSAFKVQLGFTDFKAFAKMCMQIEYPENPVPPPLLLAEEEIFPSIGEFYQAIQKAFENLPGDFKYQTDKQVPNDDLEVSVIASLTDATNAIHRIQAQGEGGPRYPFTTPGGTDLSHFYKFGQIYYEKTYQFDPATQTGFWTGTKVTIPDVYPMTPVPEAGYGAGAPQAVTDCDRLFSTLLSQLDAAWGGDASKLDDAVTTMHALRKSATNLLKAQNKRPEGGIYGPQFRKI